MVGVATPTQSALLSSVSRLRRSIRPSLWYVLCCFSILLTLTKSQKAWTDNCVGANNHYIFLVFCVVSESNSCHTCFAFEHLLLFVSVHRLACCGSNEWAGNVRRTKLSSDRLLFVMMRDIRRGCIEQIWARWPSNRSRFSVARSLSMRSTTTRL